MNLPQRLFGLLIAAVSAGGIYYVWMKAQSANLFYPKLAVFAPLGVIVGIFLMLFPRYSGTPETTRDKITVFGVFAAGIIAGLVNWVLIDPSAFGF